MAEVEPLVEIYTDGACKGNPGIGGWGALLSYGMRRKELYGGAAATTNNRMELTAVIEALKALKRPSKVRVYTDSQYVQKGITQWLEAWKSRGWRTSDKQPVKNAELWRELDALAGQHDVDWQWVKAHAGIDGNERADQLANQGIDELRRGGRG